MTILPVRLGALLVLTMGGYLSSVGAAQSGAGPRQDVHSEKPEVLRAVNGELTDLKVVSADPDFLGKLPIGARATRKLVFVNSGDAELALEVVSTTCGCTSAAFSKTVVAPRETTELEIRVTVNPGSAAQRQAVTFSIRKNGRPEPQRGVVLVKYEPDWVVEITPQILAMTVVQGVSRTAPIAVRERGDFVFPLDTLQTSLTDGHFGTVVDGITDPHYGTIKSIAFTVKGKRPGVEYGWIAPKTEAKDAPRPVVAVVRTLPAYRASPGGVIAQKGGQQTMVASLSLIARAPSAPPVASAKFEPVLEGAACTLEATDDGPKLRVTLGPAATAALWGGRIRLLDASGQDVGSVPVAVVNGAVGGG